MPIISDKKNPIKRRRQNPQFDCTDNYKSKLSRTEFVLIISRRNENYNKTKKQQKPETNFHEKEQLEVSGRAINQNPNRKPKSESSNKTTEISF